MTVWKLNPYRSLWTKKIGSETPKWLRNLYVKKVPFYNGEMREFNDASVTFEFVLRPKTGYRTLCSMGSPKKRSAVLLECVK